MPLPIRLAAEFPPELVATPIEDIDPYYANKKTFVVISKVNTIRRATSGAFNLLYQVWFEGQCLERTTKSLSQCRDQKSLLKYRNHYSSTEITTQILPTLVVRPLVMPLLFPGKRHFSVFCHQCDGLFVTLQSCAQGCHPHTGPRSLLNHNYRYHPSQLSHDDSASK